MDLVQANMGWERRIMVLAQPSLELAQPNLELKQPNLALEQPTLELAHSIVRLEQRKIAMQFEFLCPANFSLSFRQAKACRTSNCGRAIAQQNLLALHYRKSLIKTASLLTTPRLIVIHLPSKDSCWLKTSSGLKSVSCFMELPSRGTFQRFTVPLRES